MVKLLSNLLKKMQDPKAKLERLLVLVTIIVVYLFLFIYKEIFQIQIKFIDAKTLFEMPIIALVVYPFIYYLLKSDPLQRSPKKKRIYNFFQSEFPSNYILERCNKCIEDESTCPNFIKAESFTHIRYWFHNMLHGYIEKEDPKIVKDTFEKGYTCKLFYYSSVILKTFLILSLFVLAVHYSYNYFVKNTLPNFDLHYIFFPLGCLILLILIRALNNPDETNPSGYWHAWRQINRIHISWLKSHEDILVKLICYDKGNNKKFIEK
jgi:hypothetical protein